MLHTVTHWKRMLLSSAFNTKASITRPPIFTRWILIKINALVLIRMFTISVTYISWSSEFVYILKTIIMMDEGHAWDKVSMGHRHWPNQIYLGQCPILHGPVNLLNILKTVWWRNVILGIMDQFNKKIDLIKYIYVLLTYISWPHSLCLILTIWWMNVILWTIDHCDITIDFIKYM